MSRMVHSMAASPAPAMEWTILDISILDEPASNGANYPYPRMATAPRGIKVYLGRGEIVQGDAEHLLALYQSAEGGDTQLGSRKAFPEVWLDSGGGNPYAGFDIAQVIRDLRLATVVPDGAFCASACTMAFLGGIERRIEGPYLVHAASPTDEATDTIQNLNNVQLFASAYISFARGMIGDSTVADAALYFGTGGEQAEALQLDDAQLRDWNVITVAARPSQAYAPETMQTIDCAAATPATVSRIVCNDLTLGRYDARVTTALMTLDGNPTATNVVAQQPRWTAARDACENEFHLAPPTPVILPEQDGNKLRYNPETDSFEFAPQADQGAALAYRLMGQDISFGKADPDRWASGVYAVQTCLVTVYEARVRQLEALIAYNAASGDATQAGWE
jgi:hypothetical protein